MDNKKTALTVGITYIVIIAVLLIIEFVPGVRYQKTFSEMTTEERYASIDDPYGYGKAISENIGLYPDDILSLYDFEEADMDELRFVYDYPVHNNDYMNMSFKDEELNCTEIPELYMSDPRWGYERFGGNFIKTNGCSCVCLTMANLYLNHNAEADPVKVAIAAEEHNAITAFSTGISSSKIEEIAADFGMNAEAYDCYDTDYRLTEEELKAALDKEDTVVLLNEMGETFGAHMVVVSGYDENGYRIIDPGNKEHTEKTWSFDELSAELAYFWKVTSKN